MPGVDVNGPDLDGSGLAGVTEPVTAERRWVAMGSEVHAIVFAEPAPCSALLDHATARVAELEGRWTRFHSTSELSALNGSAGRPVRCSPDTVRLVEALVTAWRITNGAFDPTLLGSLIQLGYDVSRRQPSEPIALAPDCYTRGRPDDVLVDPGDGLVQLPIGTALDAGGLGKGLAADIVAAELIERGSIGALVSVGGDIAVAGTPPTAGGWCIEVQPHDGLRPERISLVAGGVATSSSRRRTWAVDGRIRHHLVDPDSGEPTAGPVTGAAVIAGSAATAEAFTKSAFVTGPDVALETYDRLGLAGYIWCQSAVGRCDLASAAWSDFSIAVPSGQPNHRHGATP